MFPFISEKSFLLLFEINIYPLGVTLLYGAHGDYSKISLHLQLYRRDK